MRRHPADAENQRLSRRKTTRPDSPAPVKLGYSEADELARTTSTQSHVALHWRFEPVGITF